MESYVRCLFQMTPAAVLAAALACSSSSPRQCDLYATMEAACALPVSREPELARQAAHIACTEAQDGDADWLEELQERRMDCAISTDSCEGYRLCKWRIRIR
jgi:hypothetical protein